MTPYEIAFNSAEVSIRVLTKQIEDYASMKNWVSVKDGLPVELPLESRKVIVYGDWNDDSVAHYQDNLFMQRMRMIIVETP